MNIKTLSKISILILIPLYIFMNPLLEYINNYGKITYVMDIPTQSFDNDIEITSSNGENVDIINLPKIEKQIVESWVVAYPEVSGNKEIKVFISKVKNMGIDAFIFVKNKNSKVKILSIGPYVDQTMAITMKNKINKLFNYDGKILRITN